ncbi:Armadillo-type fold,Armadillo-like helical [Cinara cedri]|uniref:Armadillo-type fold,Armadillo-like helical n=1 Tax=Cinara cedri TaxID=506608 RepID=A0A5E4NJK8_9HEMI|nr:Armadillo-type fold,Armadillo-like helical [Cinara cedri]
MADPRYNEKNIQIISSRLIQMLTEERDEKVLSAVTVSILNLSKTHANQIVKNMISYKQKNSLSVVENKNFLSAMKDICTQHYKDFDTELVNNLIQFTKNEMVKSSDSQFPASDILITLGHRDNSKTIICSLVTDLEEGTPPHSSLIYSLGHLASKHPLEFIDYVELFLSVVHSTLTFTKSDALRKIYATAIGQVCASVNECNTKESRKIKKELSPKVEEIFKIIIESWLISKDVKVLECVLEASSSMMMLMTVESISRDRLSILTNILSLFKRCTALCLSRYWVTQYLASFLSVVPHALLEPVIDNLLLILHDMVVAMPDYDFPMSVKNHSEVLRCYTYLGDHYGDKICELILRDLKSHSEQGKMAALLISSHLLNASNQSIIHKSAEIIPILYDLLKNHCTFQIKHLLVKIFICFANQGHLIEKEDYFFEFLVRHICFYSNNKYSNDIEGQSLKRTCEDAMYILCTSIEPVQVFCWNKILNFFFSNEYESAIPAITRCLAYMANKPDLRSIRFDERDYIIGRCINFLCQPFKDNRGSSVINFLLNYSSHELSGVHEKEFWARHADTLIKFLNFSTNKTETEWEILLLDTVNTILKEYSMNKKWCLALAENLFEDLLISSEHIKFTQDMFLLLNLVAYVAAYYEIDNLYLTKRLLGFIFHSLLKMSFENTQEFNKTITILSEMHTGLVLNKLLEFINIELTKQPNKFLLLIRDKSNEIARDRLRASISIIIPSIMRNGILRNVMDSLYDIVMLITQQINLTKSLDNKKSLVLCLEVIAEVLSKVENSDSIPNISIIREHVIKSLVNQIVNSSMLTDFMYYRVLACYIKPVEDIESIDISTRSFIIANCIDKLFQLSLTEFMDCDEASVMVTLNNLCNVLDKLILDKTGSFKIIDEIVILLNPYIISSKNYQRFMAIHILHNVLNCYYGYSDFQIKKLPICLNSSAPLFAQMCVRIAEPDKKTRINVLKCLDILLKITAVYKGSLSKNSYISKSEFVDKMMTDNSPESCQKLLEAMQQILSPADLPIFCKCLIDGLSDYEEACKLKTSELLNIFFPIIAKQLHPKAYNDILNYLFKELENTNEVVKTNNIKALITFGKYNNSDFIDLLINQTLPYSVTVCMLWHTLATEEICPEIIKSLLELMTLPPLYNSGTKTFLNKPVASLIPVAVLSGLKEILKPLPYDTAINLFPKLFNDIFLTFAALIEVGSPIRGTNKNLFVSYKEVHDINPAKIAQETLHNLFKSIELDDCAQKILTPINDIDTTVDIVMHNIGPCIIKCLIKSQFDLISIIFNMFDQSLSTTLDSQRIAIVILSLYCTETVTSDTIYTTSLISILLKCLNDTSCNIKKYCLKGLTVICQQKQIWSEEESRYIFDGIMQGLEEYQTQQSDVTLEALRGLISLIPHLTCPQFENHYTTLVFRIKQFFENENDEMRYTSIKLYGELCSKTSEFNMEVDESLHHNNIVTLLMHLCEDHKYIVQACKYSLKKVSILLNSEKMIDMTCNHLIEEGRLKYTEFITQIAKIMTEEFPSHISTYSMIGISYTKSIFPEIRASAALFVGLLYNENPNNTSFELVSGKMLMLTVDPNPKVRSSAVTCLGKLYN